MIHGVAITPFDAAAILIVLAAVLGFMNIRFLRLPQSIGLTVMGAVASLLVVGVDRLAVMPIGVIIFPGTGIQDNLGDKARKMGIPVYRFGKGGA